MACVDIHSIAKNLADVNASANASRFHDQKPAVQSALIAKFSESIQGGQEMERMLGTIFFALQMEAPYAEFGGQILKDSVLDYLKTKGLLWIVSSTDGKNHLVGPTNKMFDAFVRVEGELAYAEATAALDAAKRPLIPGVISSMLKL